jgi:rhodanese-related sulfurtransferase
MLQSMNRFTRLFGESVKEYEDLSAGAYRAGLAQQPGDHTLVDVRTREEFRMGHLPGALNIPLDQLARRVKELPAGQPVVVVCATGNRSVSGSRIIAGAGGHPKVYNLQGGTMAWARQGFPIEY